MSTEMSANLKAWETKIASKRKPHFVQQPSPTLTESEYRERGNEAYKCGDLPKAEEAYTRGIEVKPTSVECLTNRALVRLKTGMFAMAVGDCDRALSLDAKNVKALVRRATGRTGLGLHEAALDDLRVAQELEPGNAAVGREREVAEKMVVKMGEGMRGKVGEIAEGPGMQAAKPGGQTTEPGKLTAEKMVVRTGETVGKRKVLAEQMVRLEGAQTGESGKQAEERLEDPQGEQKVTRNIVVVPAVKSKPVEKVKSLNDDAVARVMSKLDESLQLVDAPPKNAYVFSKLWRDYKGRLDLRAKLLCQVMSEVNYVNCFGKSLEPDMFVEMISALVQWQDGKELVPVLTMISRLPSFSLTRMMLSSKTKRECIDAATYDEANTFLTKLLL